MYGVCRRIGHAQRLQELLGALDKDRLMFETDDHIRRNGMEENRIKAEVTKSGCPLYAVGDAVYFDGPLLDKVASGNLCMMALNARLSFCLCRAQGRFQ